MTATLTRLQEIADEFTAWESQTPLVPHPTDPHPECRAPHQAPSYAERRDAALAMLGKERARELFALAEYVVKPGHPDYPLLRDTVKRLYQVCFGLDDTTVETVLASRGF